MTVSFSPDPQFAPDGKQPARAWDIFAALTLLVLGAIGIGMLAFVSVFLSMASDGCGLDANCNLDLLSSGFLVALLGPPVAYLAAGIWTIVRLVRRKLAWWVPLVGLLAAAAVWGAGVAMLMASVSG